MANSRKVQSEIDKLLKKVSEGMDVYEEVYEKVVSAPNQVQKEKFEADLKKEIKKLQRLREQIKALIASPEVKDKRSLEGARRQIEQKMESFKVCEKETKTKAYSKEGLATGSKTDPADAAKCHTEQWLKGCIHSLAEQDEQIEFEIEAEAPGKKKKGGTDHREERLQRHKYHIQKMEVLLRMLLNDELMPEEIDMIEEDVSRYVEENGEEGFEETPGIYDQFDLPDVAIGVLPSAKGGIADEDSDEEVKSPNATLQSKSSGRKAKKEHEEVPVGGRVIEPGKKDKESPGGPLATAKGVPPKAPTAKGKQEKATKAPAPPAPKSAQVAKQSPKIAPGGFSPLTRPEPSSVPVVGKEAELLDERDELNDDTFGDDAMQAVTTGSLADMASMTQQMAGDWKPSSFGTSPMKSGSAQAAPGGSYRDPQPAPPARVVAKSEPAPPVSTPQILHRPPALPAITKMLEASLQSLPHPSDSERLKPYVPPNPYKTPPYYPQQCHPSFSNPEMFAKFEPETLFFIFYYQQATYQQCLAAKMLKRLSWRYHKKFLTWFQRHETPKSCTDEYEQGAYLYFDYESGWCQRIKNDFTFKYQYLEDELV